MKKVRGLLGAVGMGVLLSLTSCIESPSVEDPSKQLSADIMTIDNYLTANAPVGILVKDPTGVRMVIEELGTMLPAKSANPAAPTLVDIDYVGRFFPNGAIFDQGNLSGPNAKLSGFINGWKIAFLSLPVGSKAKLYIPSYWAYGTAGQGNIPPNTILVFDVEFNEAVTTTTELNKFKSDTAAIHDYVAGIANVVNDTSGISYVFTQQGGGAMPSWYSKTKVKLTYKLITDATKVIATVDWEPSDQFYSRPVDFIHGLKVGLQKMTEGSKATFYIPSGLAFGTLGATDGSGATLIPANSNLIVEVELKDIVTQ